LTKCAGLNQTNDVKPFSIRLVDYFGNIRRLFDPSSLGIMTMWTLGVWERRLLYRLVVEKWWRRPTTVPQPPMFPDIILAE
jgi:hypothetical protein